MVPGHGRLPADVIKEHYVRKIESFGLNFKKDILNSTNDGCKTMEKLGELIKKLMQLCLAHGMQLGVVKTFYLNMIKKTLGNQNENITDDDYDDNSDEDQTDSEVEESDEEEEEQISENDDDVDDVESEENEDVVDVPKMKRKYGLVIVKWRKIVNTFHGRSTPLKDQFQDAIKKWQKQQVIHHTLFKYDEN